MRCFDDECEFELVLRHKYTMSCMASELDPQHAHHGSWFPVTTSGTPENAQINVGKSTFYPEEKAEMLADLDLKFTPENCIFGDGIKTSIISINGHFPGPAIEVMQGAKVHITVKNEMHRY